MIEELDVTAAGIAVLATILSIWWVVSGPGMSGIPFFARISIPILTAPVTYLITQRMIEQ